MKIIFIIFHFYEKLQIFVIFGGKIGPTQLRTEPDWQILSAGGQKSQGDRAQFKILW